MNKVLVLGGGSWGTTLANLLAEKIMTYIYGLEIQKYLLKNKQIGSIINIFQNILFQKN
jgi:glycerol-3-phosphate dehydrogenase